MNLTQNFDAVVMLTWSDWHREPRSNRFHYATRFARELPVIFVQPDLKEGAPVTERVPDYDIVILHVSNTYGADQTHSLANALAELGVRRSLLWIYNVFFEHFILRANAFLRVYHATEDYLGPNEGVVNIGTEIAKTLKRVLKEVDLVVCVSEGVADSYRKYGNSGNVLVLRNGCDFNFWSSRKAYEYVAPANGAKVAFYQGSINIRLDFDLLLILTEALPDWEFWFCGHSDEAPAKWFTLKMRPNVRDFGMVDTETIAALASQSVVGLIPFLQDSLMRRSLPLKAYEYVACGLPVVTIPIDELAARPGLFRIARNALEFATEMEIAATTRVSSESIEVRLEVASLQSYEHRFMILKEALHAALSAELATRPQGNLLVLYDDRSTGVRTVHEHLVAFQRYSRHKIYFMPATGFLPGVDDEQGRLDLNAFDAVVIHYSVRLSLEWHLSQGIANALTSYRGPKLLFIQDEYDTTEVARGWIERLGIDAIFTNVPLASLDQIYPRSRFPCIDFIPTLTGYVPEDASLDGFALSLKKREILIGYRGRKLPYQYGDLGFDKYRIGLDVKRLAEAANLPVDIEVDDSHRIYGDDWYRFLGSCRATLGTESGANVFDFDGTLSQLAAQHSDLPYEEFRARYLLEHEGKVRMNQVSPKVFEAIRLRTALILFEGEYSGVVKPDRHFIPLRKDYSNIDDVFAKINNLDYLRELTSRAYREVIESHTYSYRVFVDGVDKYLDRRLRGRTRARITSMMAIAAFGKSGQIDNTSNVHPAQFLISDNLIGRELTREVYTNATFDTKCKLAAAHQALQEMQRANTETVAVLNSLEEERTNYKAQLSSLSEQLVALHMALNAANIPPSVTNIMWLVARRLLLLAPRSARTTLIKRLRRVVRIASDREAAGRPAPLWLRSLPSRLRELIRYYEEP